MALGGNHSAALVSNQLALAVDMRKLLNSQEFSDITLVVEDRSLYAHRVISYLRSSKWFIFIYLFCYPY